ncbi:TPA: CHAP domain-containing protein, partial [Streptococcus pyogenes]
MKKQMRYKKSREKNFKKNTSFDSSHQNISRYDNNLSDNNSMVDIQENSTLKSNGISSKKMHKNFYSQEDNSMKESMNLSKDKLVSKNQSKHFMSGQYEKNIRNDELYPLSDNGEKGQTFSRKENQKKKMRKQIDKFHKEKEVYDPLSKDMDNDGVIDRYDVDFRDSKVSYRTLADDEKYDNRQNDKEKNYDEYVKNPKSKNKIYKHYAKDTFSKESPKSENQKKYFKSNFDNQEFTRDKDTKKKSFQDVKNEGKTSDKSTSQKRKGKFENKEKKISKLQQKKQRQEQKLKNKGIDGKSQSAKSAVMATGMVKRYLESGKEDNAGVEGTHKAVEKMETISRHAYHRGKKKVLKRQKKINKLDKSIHKQEKKLFFQKNMEELKKSSEYQNTSRLKQFFKRRQYKRQIQKKYKDSVKNRIKKSFIESSKRFAEFIRARGKKMGFLLLIVIGIFFMLFQSGTMLMNMGMGMVSNTVSTTYLSSEDTLKEINQEFSFLEQALQEEMDSV